MCKSSIATGRGEGPGFLQLYLGLGWGRAYLDRVTSDRIHRTNSYILLVAHAYA